jgi:transcriptional activator SPT7
VELAISNSGQAYQNQFPKYNPEPFHEQDVEPHFISGDGPVMAAETCRSAMQRSVAKIFYHAGFEELQPSALESITDIAGDYFTKLIHTFNVYKEADMNEAVGVYADRGATFQPRYSTEEVLLHTIVENGLEVDALEQYARDDLERLGTKLGGLHERMKIHLADLLRPALNEGGADGSGAFDDGSEQFVGGDFAEELGEDFFGFKALGLDREMGLDMLSVPLHLLQTRVRNIHQMQSQTAGVEIAEVVEQLQQSEPLTIEILQDHVGVIKNFFLAKLHAGGDQPLVEDEDLPVKQRRPRPRLGATGKIVAPQKRPPKEQIAMAKKKKKLEAAQAADKAANTTPEKVTPAKKKSVAIAGGPNGIVAPKMERVESLQSQGNASHASKEDGVAMMSPESMER